MGTEALTGPAARLDEYRALAVRLNQMSDEMASMRVTRRCADGSVTATVGPTGELCDLRIDPATCLDTGGIARRVLEAAASAANDARGRRLAAVSALLPEHLRGVVDPSEWGDR
jgi:DNA-binding protein YbaB